MPKVPWRGSPLYLAHMASVDDPWSGLVPADLGQLIPGELGSWWVAGGWAIDLWLPESIREHADMDIGCYRDEVASLRRLLPAWEFFSAVGGELTLLADGEEIPGDVHTLWCRLRGTRQ